MTFAENDVWGIDILVATNEDGKVGTRGDARSRRRSPDIRTRFRLG